MPSQRRESDLERDVMRQQWDAAYMAERARRLAAVREGHEWTYDEEKGQWFLARVYDGTVHEQAA